MRFGGKAYTTAINVWRRASSRSLAERTLSALERTVCRLVAHKLPRRPDLLSFPIEVRVSDSIPEIGERIVLYGSGELTEAIRVSDSEGQSSGADRFENGTVTFAIQGRSRQGEEGNVAICRILIERLNRDGGHWGEPTAVKDQGRKEVDCEARSPNGILEIQVTRAETNQQVWRTLSKEREVQAGPQTADQTADALRESIQAKENLDKSRRAKLILALDATETASHAFRPVIESFRRRHSERARRLGFGGIWVVGPTADLTSRLDIPETVLPRPR